MEKRGVGRPRDGNPEETRREILRAAEITFAECGFAGATTRAIAGRAGVNVATLHYHFGSKEGLYKAVLASACAGTLPLVSPGPEGKILPYLVAALFAYGREHPTLARLSLLHALAGPDTPDGRFIGERVRWLADALRPLLSTSNPRSAPEPEAIARTIVALVDATFLAAAAEPAVPALDGDAPDGDVPVATPRLPTEVSCDAVVAAALRLSGLL